LILSTSSAAACYNGIFTLSLHNLAMSSQNFSTEALLASRFIDHTSRNIFLTGKAGTGKTTLLRHIVASTHKKTVIAAPTGIAAINAGGVTIHSLFQLPFGSFIPFNRSSSSHNHDQKINDPHSLIRNLQMHDNKRKLLRELELLIIDEVSMLRSDLLDAIDTVLKYVRRKNYLPFGGVQVLFIGDLLQLPPVVKNEEWELLKEFYKSPYFFDARVLQQAPPVYVELNKIYRQSDAEFISLLNNLRNNTVDEFDIELLSRYYNPGFKPPANENYITLTTHNNKANDQNKKMLQELKGESYYFDALIEDDFNEFSYPVDKRLELKVGAQVMFVKNDPSGNQRFFNGKIAVVKKLSNDKITVEFENGDTIDVEEYKWENIKFVLNATTNEIEEQVVGTFTQYPLKLAWAITVHKSQGLTFDKAIIDIGQAFAPGQVYVALSRLRSLDGLVLTSPVNLRSITEDKKVADFSRTKDEQEDPQELLKKETLFFLRTYVIENFDLAHLVELFDAHAVSYTKDEKRSAKQKHYKWAVDLAQKIRTLKEPADKFIRHFAGIVDRREEGFLELAYKRLGDANEYFAPTLKEISKSIFAKIEEVQNEKKIKGYVNELLELEVAIYEQVKRLNKSIVICAATLDDVPVEKTAGVSAFEKERNENLLRVLSASNQKKDPGAQDKPTKKKRERKPGEPKKAKGDTQKETLRLFKEGKGVEEIALLRGISQGTIEGHLSTFIAKGQLDARELVPEDKIETILKVAKQLDTFNLGPIKNELGDEYSYGEIRMALAGYLGKE
jgi:DNA-binding CsgD family transcriptional regulator/nucleoside-triphosphatase THEP1